MFLPTSIIDTEWIQTQLLLGQRGLCLAILPNPKPVEDSPALEHIFCPAVEGSISALN